MPFNVLESITQEERFNFSQDFSVKRPGILDTIFPDVKTQYLKAEYYRLMAGQRLPEVAFVHALDTEAEIGTRPGFEKVLTEKLFIKRKINQSERLQQAIENGVPDNEALKNFVFDDAANLFEGVVARANVMKGQFLSTGAVKVKENNVELNIDYGVPATAKVALTNWATPEADIMGDIQKMVAVAEDNGYVVNKALTSLKMINHMRNNTAMQTAVLGAANKRLLTKQELANLLMQEYGITIDRCDEKFHFRKADGSLKTGRYFKEDVFTLYEADANGSFGTGLWGVTPEELEYRQFIQEENRSFVTLSMWATQDPVAVWTKASGMFVPVAPKANGGIVIGTKGGITGHSLNVNSQSPSVASVESKEPTHKYTESELSNMTVPQLRQLASDNGYALTSTNKAGIISEILVQQG